MLGQIGNFSSEIEKKPFLALGKGPNIRPDSICLPYPSFGLGLAVSGRVCRFRVAGTISAGKWRKSLKYWMPSFVRYQ